MLSVSQHGITMYQYLCVTVVNNKALGCGSEWWTESQG